MYIKTDTQRVQRILTATVMAAAIMSALCLRRRWRRWKQIRRPAGHEHPDQPGGGLPGNPGTPGNPGNPGNPDPGGPTTPTTTPARCKPPGQYRRPWTTSCP